MLDLTDWQNKKYQTKSGKPVRILCVDAKDQQQVVGLVTTEYVEEPEQWSIDGTYNPGNIYESSSMDLINAKTKREGWVNIGPYGPYESICWIYNTKEEADDAAGSERVACIHIEWEE
jgi:hypothetical protein